VRVALSEREIYKKKDLARKLERWEDVERERERE
jgi:hypothetical protein